jgi:quercetin dioxygenase-like cupin family protein
MCDKIKRNASKILQARAGAQHVITTDLPHRHKSAIQFQQRSCRTRKESTAIAGEISQESGEVLGPTTSKEQQRKDLNMNIQRAGSQPSSKGPADWFSGTVRIDSPFKGTDPARVTGAIVTFEPGARTAWHTHPLGQTLIVTAGCGWVQRWGEPVEEVRPADVVWFPPGEKHWHGATPTTALSHIAIQEQLDGKAVQWMEKVTDEQYRK